MGYSIDQILGAVSQGGGVARPNLFKVFIPVVPNANFNQGLDGSTMNLLCKNVSLPGRQILTHDRIIGVVAQKVAYGYSVEPVNMTFIGLNDYGVRRYLHSWYQSIVNKTDYTVKYKKDYVVDITIHQLDHKDEAVYGVKLIDAFPTQILNIDLSNEQDQLVDIGATFDYTDWHEVDFSNPENSSNSLSGFAGR